MGFSFHCVFQCMYCITEHLVTFPSLFLTLLVAVIDNSTGFTSAEFAFLIKLVTVITVVLWRYCLVGGLRVLDTTAILTTDSLTISSVVADRVVNAEVLTMLTRHFHCVHFMGCKF